jgi:hypothetical protein
MYFNLLKDKQPMFQCLVEECGKKFKTRHDRRQHLKDFHKYPADHVFDERPKQQQQHQQQKQKKKQKSDTKMQLRNTAMDQMQDGDELMGRSQQQPNRIVADNTAAATEVTTAVAPTAPVDDDEDDDVDMADITASMSRFKITERSLPKNFSFGRRGRRR